MQTKTAVNRSSVPSSTGTGAGSASNPTPSQAQAASTAPPASVVGKKGLRLKLQEMLSGWQAVIPPGSGVPSQQGTLDKAAIGTALQGFVGNYTNLDAATLALQSARGPVKASEAAANALFAELKLALTAWLGPTSPQLALFGLKPKGARRQLTVAQKTAKVARASNTRTIRGTKGKLQKATLVSGPMQVSVAPTAQPAAAVGAPSQGSPPGSK